MLDKTNAPAPSTRASVTVVPTDAELVGEVVGLVADVNSLATEIRGKMARAIELLRDRRDRDPETFPALFEEVSKQIEDRRRRSELRLAIRDDRDIAAEAAKRQAKRMAKLKAAADADAAADVRTHGQSEPAPEPTPEPASPTTPTIFTKAQLVALNQGLSWYLAQKPPYLDGPDGLPFTADVSALARWLASAKAGQKFAPASITTDDPLAAFKYVCTLLDNEDDLAEAVAYLDKHVRKVITPEMRLADAKAKAKADAGEEDEEEAPVPAPKPKAKRKGAKK